MRNRLLKKSKKHPNLSFWRKPDRIAGAILDSRRLARRAEYMDVFRNPAYY
jgi:hypothetical protein